ncbi:conjugal transfer mating pair stabilization protein TraN [Caedimonas varicaedens]|uniref:Conjugal transfer mating pair stabilization protein TraN n=1 Tax=Caedimonas varicaedens TaxID=1629334 RepID=A0A0K8MFU0_9PROT|nr:conjugal transfer mating pair stabilization protein TraN [Caedimonas varicaedens]
MTYACQPNLHRGCEEFKKKGCVQINSECKEYKGKSCITFTQTYECLSQQDGQTLTTLSGKIPYCLDGQCVDQGFAPNEDMADVLSTLAILNAIQKDKDMSGPSIFKGDAYGCNRNCINFKDCCGSGDGWGVSMGLAGCSEKEKALAELRPQSKCVYVGTYCAEKEPVTKICIRKKSNYCCFGSKMARLIQEQGRKQLHISFGSADSPQCRGLTIEELDKIDFSKVDLSELFAEVWSKMKAPNVQKLSEDFQESWSHRTDVLDQGKTSDRDHLQQEKPDAVF